MFYFISTFALLALILLFLLSFLFSPSGCSWVLTHNFDFSSFIFKLHYNALVECEYLAKVCFYLLFSILCAILSFYIYYQLYSTLLLFFSKIRFSQILNQELFKSLKFFWVVLEIETTFRIILKPYLPFYSYSLMRVYLHFQRLHSTCYCNRLNTKQI